MNRTVRIAKAGISLTLPANWIVFSGGVPADAATLKALIKANPQMRDFLNQQVQSADAKNIQFEARDLDTGDNVDVTVEPREGWPKSLRTLRAELMPIISKAGYTLVTASPPTV